MPGRRRGRAVRTGPRWEPGEVPPSAPTQRHHIPAPPSHAELSVPWAPANEAATAIKGWVINKAKLPKPSSSVRPAAQGIRTAQLRDHRMGLERELEVAEPQGRSQSSRDTPGDPRPPLVTPCHHPASLPGCTCTAPQHRSTRAMRRSARYFVCLQENTKWSLQRLGTFKCKLCYFCLEKCH